MMIISTFRIVHHTCLKETHLSTKTSSSTLVGIISSAIIYINIMMVITLKCSLISNSITNTKIANLEIKTNKCLIILLNIGKDILKTCMVASLMKCNKYFISNL